MTKVKFNATKLVASAGVALAPLAFAAPAFAQAAAADGASGQDIIVTARKRSEALSSAPLAVTALSTDELERRAIRSMTDIAKVVPSLLLSDQDNNQTGGAIVMRGISGVHSNPFGDQAVSFNIDGVQIARSSVKRLSNFDMDNVQVLQGPQALYYGKNSPAGIIVIRTADPTDHFTAGASTSYEFNGREVRGDAYVAGPIGDGAGFRIAAYGDHMRGWVRNTATPDPLFGPLPVVTPRDKSYGGRLTLTFKPSDVFDARLKVTGDRLENAGWHENVQLVACPTGRSQLGTPDDCTADDRIAFASMGPNFFKLFGAPWRADGRPFLHVTQYLAGLEMNYHLSDALTLSSQTGYYRMNLTGTGPFNSVNATTATAMIAGLQRLRIEELSQEVRLTSDFAGSLNFMLGGYFQHNKLMNATTGALNAVAPFVISAVRNTQTGNAPSVFGSVNFKPTEQIEISGGARWSREKKEIACYNSITGALCNPAFPRGTANPRGSWTNISPELTISWRPTNLVTVYGSYKQGFLSGGFNANSGNVTADRRYDEETVKGFEAGVKARMLDGALRLTIDAWRYKIGGQQVFAILYDQTSISTIISNAAAARSQGVEANLVWNAPIEGLRFSGGITYTDAFYLRYTNANCSTGQTPAEGCNRDLLNGAFNSQDLSGAVLPRAPKWVETFGASYSVTDGGNRYTVSVDGNHNSSFMASSTNNRFDTQKGYWQIDAALRFETANGIELALIGKNLTNEYYFQDTTNSPLTGSGTGTAAGRPGDSQSGVSRGRQILVRAGIKLN